MSVWLGCTPEGQAGQCGVAASRAAADAEALLVGLALLRKVLGRVAAVVYVHDAPVLAQAVAVLPPVASRPAVIHCGRLETLRPLGCAHQSLAAMAMLYPTMREALGKQGLCSLSIGVMCCNRMHIGTPGQVRNRHIGPGQQPEEGA